jgi:putative photosynthetic complex assembly protein 2
MSPLAWAFVYTLFAWWFSTGAILYLDGLPRRTFPHTMAATTVLLVAALWGLVHTRGDTSVTGAYCAFTCALLVWAWQEVAFLLGWVTGPRRTACPLGAQGWRRFGFALQAVLYHELALIVLAVAVWPAWAMVPTRWAGGPSCRCGSCARAPSSTSSWVCATWARTSCPSSWLT